MEQEEALDFYKRITEGTDSTKTISLTHSSGSTLEDVTMRPVDKTTLASVIQRMPDEMFESVEGAEDADDAEEQLEEAGGSMAAVNEDTVTAFEEIVSKSLSHKKLTRPQMEHIAAELNFEMLFELGTEIINMSVEQTGSIKDFHVPE
jgi:hypothetical protein